MCCEKRIDSNFGKSFVAIMIVIGLVSLALRFGVSRFITLSIAQNESDAQVTLKMIAAAIDNYAKDHLGVYPSNLSLLVKNKPSYLDKDYVSGSVIKGYDYSCARLDETGYSCSAVPQICNFSGRKIFTITGGGLSSDDCVKKE